MEKTLELEEMKQQLHLLQQRLDKQVEINEKQTRRAIEEGVGSLRRKGQKELRLCLVVAFVLPVCLYIQGLHMTFVMCSLSMLMANAGWKKYLIIDDSNFACMSMIEVSNRLLKYKKDKRNSIFLGLPIAILWCVWYGLNISDLPIFGDCSLQYLYIVLAIGGVIGFIIGMTQCYLPSMRAADCLLRQIREVQGE